MSSISSLSAAVSALMSSQTALNTTAHNLANVDTTGYVRQQVLFKDNKYMTTGQNETTGFYVGLGVDIQSIRQVRDRFLDQSYRQENARKNYYTTQNNAIDEIETILGETEGESFATILNDLWTSMNELAKHPDGLETRGSFVENVVQFTDRANLIMEQLNDYQNNLNVQVEDIVNNINDIGDQISALNDIIVKEELNGGNANDYRDQRNLLLDELSSMVSISYKEDQSGSVKVSVEGMEFVTKGGVNKMTLEPAAALSQMVKPVWTNLGGVNSDVYDLSQPVGTEYDNDKGALKSLLYARGDSQANWTDMLDTAVYEETIKPSVIMNAQAQFDNLIHGIVTMINDTLSPNTGSPAVLDTANAPYGLDGSQGIELFVRKNLSRYDGSNQYNEEDTANTYTLYTTGNIEVNPDILEDYNKICLSGNISDVSDDSVIKDMLDKWETPFSSIEPGLSTQLDFQDYYNDFIAGIGDSGNAANTKMTDQDLMTTQIDNQRSSLMGVSSDEELGNMIKYQHAYNAAAKVVNVLDQMMEQVVKSTGLVGR